MRIRLLLFLIVGTLSSNAQPDIIPGELDWGLEYKEPTNSYLSQIIYTGSNQFFAIREKREGLVSTANAIYLERYDSELELKRSEEIDLKYKSKVQDFEEMIHLRGSLYLFTSFYNQAHQNRYLFVQTVDKRRLKVGRSMEMIAEAPGKERLEEGSFDFRFSEDSSKVLIFNQLPVKRQDPERFHLRIFNDSLELEWDRMVQMPYANESFSVEEYRIDENGRVYLLGVIYKDGTRERRKGKPTYEYVLLVFEEGLEEAEMIQIDPGDYFITDLTFRVSQRGDMVCSGFYSTKGTYSVKGTCFFKIDGTTLEVNQTDLQPFEFEFMSEFMTDREMNRVNRSDGRKEPELYEYGLDRLILRSDGGALLVAEQYYAYSIYTYDYRGMSQTRNYYHYNDLIVVNINPDGKIEWATRIPKRQVTLDDGGYYSSYSMAVVRDRLFFVYNDNPRNFDEGRNRDRLYNFNGSQSVITLAEVQRDGKLEVYPMLRNKETSVITRPKMCKQTGSKEMILYGEQNRRYRFATLSF